MAKRLMLPVLNRHAGGICPFFAAENYNLFSFSPSFLPSFSPSPLYSCVWYHHQRYPHPQGHARYEVLLWYKGGVVASYKVCKLLTFKAMAPSCKGEKRKGRKATKCHGIIIPPPPSFLFPERNLINLNLFAGVGSAKSGGATLYVRMCGKE